MNIQMQLGGICILLLLLYFYKRQGTLGLCKLCIQGRQPPI